MKIQLITTELTELSEATQSIWQAVCEELSLSLDVIDSETPEGQLLVEELALRTLPALIVDNKIIAVGQPDHSSARKILQNLEGNTD